MHRVKNFISYLIVISGLYFEFNIIIGIWSFITLFAMAISAGICAHRITVEIDRNNIPLTVKLKYDIFYSYWMKHELPAWLDAVLYLAVIVFSALNGLWIISTAWLSISYFDFKMREMAMKEQSDLIAYAISKGVGK